MINTNELRFFWNGIKVGKGKLQRAWASTGKLINSPEGTLTIYAREYTSFSPEVHAAFKVENNTDSMTDYFEKDHIRIEPSHPLYAQVVAGMVEAANRHYAKRFKEGPTAL